MRALSLVGAISLVGGASLVEAIFLVGGASLVGAIFLVGGASCPDAGRCPSVIGFRCTIIKCVDL